MTTTHPSMRCVSLPTSELSAVFLMVAVTAILTSRGGWSVIVYTTCHSEIHPLNKVTRRWKSYMPTIIIIKKRKPSLLIQIALRQRNLDKSQRMKQERPKRLLTLCGCKLIEARYELTETFPVLLLEDHRWWALERHAWHTVGTQ